MTLGKQIRQCLSSRVPIANRVEEIIASEPGLLARLQVTGAESLGLALSQLEIVHEGASTPMLEPIGARASHICDKVTYLLERLRPIEVDDGHFVALMRSDQPSVEADEIAYYELLLEDSRRLNLRRYRRAPRQAKRVATDIILTHAQLERLVEDLSQLSFTGKVHATA